VRQVTNEQKWVKRLEKVGALFEALGAGRGCKSLPEGTITEVRLLMPSERRADVLVVVKASTPAGKFVGFAGGPDPVTAILIYRKKEAGSGLKFREERPYGE